MKKILSIIFAVGSLVSISAISIAAPIPEKVLQSAQEFPPPVVKNDARFDRTLLDDVAGVSLQLYTRIVYDELYVKSTVYGEDDLQAEHNITKAQLAQANKVFNKRLQADRDQKNFKFTNLFVAYLWSQPGAGGRQNDYAKDFVQSALNDGPLYLDPPMTMKKFQDLMRYHDNKIVQEPDRHTLAASDRVLKDKGYSFEELQVIGVWLRRAYVIEMHVAD